MYRAIALVTIVVAMITVPAARADIASFRIRPHVIENGADVVTLPFPSDAPNGTARTISRRLFGRNVYRYDIYNGAFTGPYEPTLIDQLYAGPFVGPDDNVWTVRLDADPHHYYWPMAFQVFVRKIQTLEPTAISVSAGSPTYFAILETHLNGPWTSVSLNPSLATASPSSSTTGQFTVSETRPGNTSIKVTDKLGSSSYETVNVH